MKTNKVLLNIVSFFCFIYFAIYIFTLVFIPIGIYVFLAGKNFAYKAEHQDDTMRLDNKTFKRYMIFTCIFVFPFGLLSIIPYIRLTSNNITISTVKVSDESSNENPSMPSNPSSEETESASNGENSHIETEEEKQEKFQKLQNFKEKGYITEEELEQAREQIFGKKED